MLSTSIQFLWALLFVELYLHIGIHAGDVKIGAFYGEDTGGFGDVFGTVIQDGINRVRNNRTLLPEPHGMQFVKGDVKPVNAVYTAIEEICTMINAERPSALIILDDKCPDCGDIAGIMSHGSNPIISVDIGAYGSGSRSFKMYPSPEDMSDFYIDLLHYFKWRAFTLLIDGTFENLAGVMDEAKKYDWNATVVVIDHDNLEDTLVETTTAKSKNIFLFCMNEMVCRDVLDKGIEMNHRKEPIGPLNSKYTWILGNLDLSMPEQYKDQLEDTNAYMTYFTMNFTRELQYTKPSARSQYDSIYSFPMREKLAYDAVLAIGHALSQFVERKAQGGQRGDAVLPGDTQMLTCPTAVDVAANNDLTNQLMGISFEGQTGNVAFDQDGNRINYTITIFSGRGDTLRQLRGEWTQNPDYLEDRRGFEWESEGRLNTTAFRNAKDRKIRIVSVEIPPFLFLRGKLVNAQNDEEQYQNYRYRRQDAPPSSSGSTGSSPAGQYTGNGRFVGYIMNFLERISTVIRGIDFEYEVELVSDGKYGAPGKYSKIWNGMIGEVVRGKADVAVGPLTVLASRKAAVDFTSPFMASGIQALTLNTEYVHHDPFRITYPFTIEVWMINGFIFFLTALMLWAFNRLDPYEWRTVAKENEEIGSHKDDFSFKGSLWFCSSTLFLQGYHSSPRSNAGRCIAGFWWLLLLAMVFLYIFNLRFFVNSQTAVNYIKDASDLKGEKRVLYGTTFKGTDTYRVFKESNSLQSMWHKMNNDPKKPYVNDLKEGVERVRNSNGFYVLLGQAPILRYIASQKPCDVDVTGSYLLRTQYAFAVAKGSPLREHLSAAVETLRDNGVLADLERDWWDLDDRSNRCRNQTAFERGHAYSLFINDMSGFYYLLTIGIVASAIVFVLEYVYYGCRGDNERQHSPAPKKPKKKKAESGNRRFGLRNGDGHQQSAANQDKKEKRGDDNMWI